jgi:protoporphyrinogen oxidase
LDRSARPPRPRPVSDAALGPAVKVFRTGLLDDASAADIGWARVPLGVLHGEHARVALDAAGVEVLTDVPVERIERENSGFTVVAPDRRQGADAVVLAVPHDVAPAMLPAGALAPGVDPVRLGNSPVVDVHLVLDRKVTDLAFAAVVDSPLQFVFDRTESSGATGGQVLAVSLSAAGTHLPSRPEALATEMFAALGHVVPEAGDAGVLDAVVTKERSATFRAAPGARAHRPGAATPIPGLALAGTWTDTGWPATMEGAVRSGLAAARAVTSSPAVTVTEEASV